MPTPMRWDVYCRVVDNFGDIGFAWRLACDLAGRGQRVRLIADDASALAWLAPHGGDGVEVPAWPGPVRHAGEAAADAVVETFGCGLPTQADGRVFINVEHLSAEPFVERSHGLPSPGRAPSGEPRTVWFHYPGFTTRTGGLLREPGLLAQRRDFGDGRVWLASIGVAARPDERIASLFCYDDAPLEALLDVAAESRPTLLLLAGGASRRLAEAALGPALRRGALRALPLPLLAQPDYDRLLWSCELNFVRGEDSLVRALWAGAPFVWQPYVQADGAHLAKLDAFVAWFLADAPAAAASAVAAWHCAWNRATPTRPALSWPGAGWAGHCAARRDALAAQADLVGGLIAFVASRR